jgi:hypothetical protein
MQSLVEGVERQKYPEKYRKLGIFFLTPFTEIALLIPRLYEKNFTLYHSHAMPGIAGPRPVGDR